MKALIVDDNLDARIVIKYSFEEHGWETVEASDGQEGLEMAAEQKPDLIVSDAMMPKMDGFQFLKSVKGDAILKRIPFVFYSAVYTGYKEQELALSLGAEKFITKPKDMDAFWEEVKPVIEKRKPKKEVKGKLVAEDEEFLRKYAQIVATKLEEKVQELEKEIKERMRAVQALRRSENEYRILTINIPGMIYRKRPDWSIEIFTNSELVCGYSPGELNSGKVSWAQILLPEDRERVLMEESILIDRKISIAQEYRIVAKDGSVRWVEDRKTSIFSTEGICLGAEGVVFDVTERKRAEDEAKRFSQRNEQILNSAGEGIFGSDKNGNITFVNPAAANMLGFTVEELIGKNSHAIFHHTREDGTHYPMEECPLYLSLKEGRFHRAGDEVFWPKDGKKINIELISTPLTEQDTIAGAVVVFKDVTERKQYEEKLKTMNEALEKKVRERTAELEVKNRKLEELAKLRAEFISTASHDLRAPLTGVLGFAELLMRGKAGPLNETAERYLNTIHRSGKDLLNIIEDFLEISRIDAGRLQVNKQEVNVVEEINRSAALLESLFTSKKLQLAVEIEENLPTVDADPNRFNQMMTNYLSNALKFTPEGGRVAIKARKKGDFVEVSVVDNGIGISHEDQKKLFERFFQAEATKYTVKGTGLGLSIVKQLAEIQGGAVGVESAPKKETTFWFTLPVFRGTTG